MPRQDYAEIAQRLGAHVYSSDLQGELARRLVRPLEQHLRLSLVAPMLTARQRSPVMSVLSTSEKVAIPLAALLRFGRNRPKVAHIVIAHKLSSGLKRPFLRLWALHRSFSQLICVSAAQAQYAEDELDIPAENTHFIHDKVDHRFFHPLPGRESDYVLVVGREQRDYETFLSALAGTRLRVVIAASSPWSSTPLRITNSEDSETTILGPVSYTALRELYAGACLVVVPLKDVDYAAGVNAVLEAMAMGKAVVVSDTAGLKGYVRQGITGRLVPPTDVPALREAVLALWHGEGERARLGYNARQAVEEGLNLDHYVENIVNIFDRASRH